MWILAMSSKSPSALLSPTSLRAEVRSLAERRVIILVSLIWPRYRPYSENVARELSGYGNQVASTQGTSSG